MNSRTVLCFILFATFALRLAGVVYGPYHADEPIVVNHALAYGTGDLNPHFFKIPPLASYLVFFVYGLLFVIGRVVGLFPDLLAFQTLFVQKPVIFYILARLTLGVMPGVLAVYFLFRFALRFFSTRTALTAAALLSVNFLHTRDSHYAYVDIWMSFAAFMAVFLACKIIKEGRLSSYVQSGFWIGVATAFKYNAVLAGASLLVAHGLSKEKKASSLIIGVLMASLVYVLLNPFSIVSFNEFIVDVIHQSTAESHVGLWHPVAYSLAGAGGWPWILAGVTGLYLLALRDKKIFWVIISPMLLFYLQLVFFSQKHERYVLPLVPFLCLGAAIALERFLSYKKAVFIFALIVFPLAKTIQADILFAKKDTRDDVTGWIEKNIPEDTAIAFEHSFYRPLLQRSTLQWEELEFKGSGLPDAVRLKYRRMKDLADPERPKYRLYFLSDAKQRAFSTSSPILPFDIDTIRKEGISYLILHRAAVPYHVDFSDSVTGQLRLLRRFSPYKDSSKSYALDKDALTCAAYSWKELFSRERFGPVLEIYETRVK